MRNQRRRSASLHGKYNSFTFLIRNFQPLAIFCACTAAPFASDLFGNHIVEYLMTRLIKGALLLCCNLHKSSAHVYLLSLMITKSDTDLMQKIQQTIIAYLEFE